MPLTLILFVGLDSNLMAEPSLVLQSAGYLVITAYSIQEAVRRFKEGDFDLVLLSQSISTKEKDRLTAWIRASGSRIPMVSISEQLYRDASTVVTVGSEPAALLWGVREVLISGGILAARTAMSPDKRQTAEIPAKELGVPSIGYRLELETTNGRLVPFARRG